MGVTAEPRTITTMRADQLQPGDLVRLVGDSDNQVLRVEPPGLLDASRIVVIIATSKGHGIAIRVWLWKYSRVEVLSDVSGRGHLVTPMHAELEAG